ncbi:V-type ATPase subunit [Candidatus Micrarchaeota archaeon]|nr:V-type ATPase subunit [Candidatus Micrarchaeota archaeon]MBU1166609.1 V-type ATPase subunit [Candidatus Micrarchaeota archaeon]MBU1887259.1 V-type ATPase subunit [Candidatus Micrarchaeota archaeon]
MSVLDMLPRIESRALKYGYSNARIKAMKGLLLKPSFLDELIKVGSVDAMIELLQRTDYKIDLSAASFDYSGSELIETVASQNFARTVQKVLRFTPEGDRHALRALLVKWDLLNLKTIMHAKRLGRSYDDTKAYLFPVGGLSDDDFKRLLKADEKTIFREIKRTKLGEQMLSTSTAHFSKRMWEKFRTALRSVDMFVQMETIIDAYLYLLMDKGLAEINDSETNHIRNILKKEIDARNILIIERLKNQKTDPSKIRDSLIKGGTLKESFITRLIDAKDFSTVMNLIKNKFPSLDMANTKDTNNVSLVDLEIALEKSLAIQKTSAFYRAVLSVGVVLGFLLLKEEEVNNLRKIAKGKEFGMSEEDVKNMLVIV